MINALVEVAKNQKIVVDQIPNIINQKPKKNIMENFGKKGTDKVTGFSGVITAKINYMYGCSQYGITPPIGEDMKRRDVEWFDEGRIEIGEKIIEPASVQVEVGGCEYREHPNN